jgi:UDPglucose--hexose-1-phosphate uridylyltransferase
VRRTASQLADGREIIYFDDVEGRLRDVPDTRVLPARAPSTEARYDPVLDEWVTVATHRQGRTHLPPSDECPLCPSTEGRPTEIPATDYDVVVFENRFPSFPTGDGGGRCEIMCFTAAHDASFADLSPQRVRTVLEAWVDRTLALSELPGVEQVFPFENRGQAIGVTLSHPHGQIYAYPFTTPRTRRMLESAERYRNRTNRNLFADVLASEEREGVRMVSAGEHWLAFVPAAARWPVEIHVYPRRAVADLPSLDEEEREAFGVFYLDLLRRLDMLYGIRLPYVSAWHQAPVNAASGLAYLHLEILSVQRSATKLKYLAGSEAAMGAFINDVAPEHLAARLRDSAPVELTHATITNGGDPCPT